jgi:hypothetical protein
MSAKLLSTSLWMINPLELQPLSDSSYDNIAFDFLHNCDDVTAENLMQFLLKSTTLQFDEKVLLTKCQNSLGLYLENKKIVNEFMFDQLN